MPVFVGAPAHRMVGCQLSAAESVAGCDRSGNNQSEQNGGAGDLFTKPKADEYSGPDDRAESHQYSAGEPDHALKLIFRRAHLGEFAIWEDY